MSVFDNLEFRRLQAKNPSGHLIRVLKLYFLARDDRFPFVTFSEEGDSLIITDTDIFMHHWTNLVGASPNFESFQRFLREYNIFVKKIIAPQKTYWFGGDHLHRDFEDRLFEITRTRRTRRALAESS